MANENDGKDNSALEEAVLLGGGSDRRTSVGAEATPNGRTTTSPLEEGACVHGKINDLVADLGPPSAGSGGSGKRQPPSFGDCTNIRATTLHIEGLPLNHVKEPTQPDIKSGLPATQPPPHNSTSTFSFKHFLNTTSSTVTAPSTTVTSLDATQTSGGGGGGTTTTTTTTTTSSHTSSSQTLQTSTGARPKVPQSSSVSSQSISSLAQAQAGGSESSAFATKMKRSPRFSSFDSQASLAEYAGAGPPGAGVQRLGGSGGYEDSSLFVEPNDGNSSGSCSFRVYPDALECGDNSVFFFGKKSSHEDSTTNGGQQHPVQRSVSNYDMPAPPTSPRRRLVGPRPNRLALNTSGNKLKLDLRLDTANGASGGGPLMRPAAGSSNAAGEFPPAAAASALPDFVQDHWMDSWYAHDMHLNSQPGSPISDFFEDFASSHGGGGGGTGPGSGSVGGLPAPHPNDCREAGAMGGAGAAAGCATASGDPDTASNSKTLPDFLADGPIIHSSQRLADVTVGLPANSAGSPEEEEPASSVASQLSVLRIENERLQRELEDARVALGEQTRRADDYEWQLHEYAADQQASRAAATRPECGGLWPGEAGQQQWSRGAAPAQQSHVSKLKQQIMQITTEVECLRRENEMLREEGAVGGCSSAPDACQIEPNIAKAAAAAAAAATHAHKKRPSKAKDISRDLLRAAANAELNLKQLLLGVDNLRQMAANIVDTDAGEESDEDADDDDLFNDVFSCGE